MATNIIQPGTDLQGPQGNPGPDGPEGPEGPAGPAGGALASANEVELTGTAAQTIATYTPSAAGAFLVGCRLRVTTATTVVTAQVAYTDATGAQTSTWLNAVPKAPGSYDLMPIVISSAAGSAITVSVTAGTANQVYAGAAIWGTASGSGGGSFDTTPVQDSGWAAIASGGNLTLPSTPTAGNYLILLSSTNQYNVSSVAQTGVAWIMAATGHNNNPANVGVDIWIGIVGSGAGTAVTVTYNGNNQQGAWVGEFKAVPALIEPDQTVSSFSGGSGTASASLAILKSGAAALLCFFGSQSTAAVTFSPTPASGWSAPSGGAVALPTSGWYVDFRVFPVPAAGAYVAEWTGANSSPSIISALI